MEVTLKGLLLDCDFEEWTFEDKKGVRYYCTVKDENKRMVQFKIEESEFNFFKDMIGKNISVNCRIFIKGTYSLKVIGVN